MKKLFLILAMCLYMVNGFSQQIDTLYYDSNRKGVASAILAHYYKIIVVPDDPNYSKRFKDYSVSGALLAEGEFVCVDKYDDLKSIYKGPQLEYYNNGNIKREFSYQEGLIEGTQKEYLEDGTLKMVTNFQNGIKDGEEIYYIDGKPIKIVSYKKGRIHGTLQELDEFGNPIVQGTYDNGLAVGAYTFKSGGDIYRGKYKEINPSLNPHIRISCSVQQEKVAVKTQFNWLSLSWDNAYKEKYVEIINFDLNIQNLSEQDIICQIDNVKIEYVNKKGKTSKNVALSESEALDIFQTGAAHLINSAYKEANRVAYTAATQTHTSYSSNTSHNTTNVNIKNNSQASSKNSSVSVGVAGAVAADNNGYAVAGVGASASASASSNTAKKKSETTGSINQTQNSYNSSTAKTTDGYLQYQVYQQEKVAADKLKEDVEKTVSEFADNFMYVNFEIKNNDVIKKAIIGNAQNKLDTIRLSFDLNGITYTTEWASDEIDKRY